MHQDQGKIFVKKNGRRFEKEVCNLVALQLNSKKVNYEKKIFDIYEQNMYKFNGFGGVKKFLQTEFSEAIESFKDDFNFNDANVSTLCKDSQVSFLKVWTFCY